MTEPELDELLTDCPVLYHMAEPGAWPQVQRHGLLSTAAILDLYGVEGEAREAVLARRRPEGVPFESAEHGRIVVRDQKPLNDAALLRCLTGGLAPADWYQVLNARVFFWLDRGRVSKLLDGRAYRHLSHEVMEFEARPLVEAYRDRIELAAINTGATGQYPVARGPETFARIDDYPYAHWRGKRRRGERAVELTVPGAVPDAARYVTRVRRMRGETVEVVLYER